MLGSSPGRGRARPKELTSEFAPLLAIVVVAVVFIGFGLNAFIYVVSEGAGLERTVPALAALVALLVLQLGVISNPRLPPRSPRQHLALAFQLPLVGVPTYFFGLAWLGMLGFLAGSALLVLRPGARWPVFAVVSLSGGALTAVYTAGAVEIAYAVVITLLTGLTVYGLSRLRQLVLGLQAAQSESAMLAVVQERLWFAHDLHELLGHQLSAVALKSVLAQRLVARCPDRARVELTEIIDLSRRALADVRSVARSYRELSLHDEVAAVRSVLAAADIEVTVHLDREEMPPDIRAVLVAALREGVDNLLQHSDPRHCELAVTRSGGSVHLEFVNDGAPTAPAVGGGGGGIDGLATRLRRVNGRLSNGPGSPGTYRLHVEVPIPDDRRSGEPGDSVRRGVPGLTSRPMELSVAQRLVAAVLTGYFANGVLFVLDAGLGAAAATASLVCVAGVFVLQIGVFSLPHTGFRSDRQRIALLVQAVLVYLPILLFQAPEVGLPGFLAGSVLLVLRSPGGWIAFAGVVTSIAGVQAAFGGGAVGISYGILATINHGLVVYGLSRLRSLVTSLHDARSDLARLAVTQERFRFARDLHDLLGYSLSAITLKSELADRLVGVQTERAQTELRDVLGIARQALADVRSVTGSYRELALDDEIASVSSVLAAADITLTLQQDGGELAPEIATVLATVLREGVTNLLRHSTAEHCSIALARRGDAVTLMIENDGAPATPDGSCGAGITNLTTRVHALRGTLSAKTVYGRKYRLDAEIPFAACDTRAPEKPNGVFRDR